jgi:hypothetical protein
MTAQIMVARFYDRKDRKTNLMQTIGYLIIIYYIPWWHFNYVFLGEELFVYNVNYLILYRSKIKVYKYSCEL